MPVSIATNFILKSVSEQSRQVLVNEGYRHAAFLHSSPAYKGRRVSDIWDVQPPCPKSAMFSTSYSCAHSSPVEIACSCCIHGRFTTTDLPSRTSPRSRKLSDLSARRNRGASLRGEAVFHGPKQGTPGFLPGVLTCAKFLEKISGYLLTSLSLLKPRTILKAQF
jgi:hypothetical protein